MFVGKKCGVRTPVYSTRWFVFDSRTNNLSYWASEQRASTGSLDNRRGVIHVVRAAASQTKAAQAASAAAAAKEAEAASCRTNKASQRSVSKGHCILEIEDEENKVHLIKGVHKQDIDCIVDMFNSQVVVANGMNHACGVAGFSALGEDEEDLWQELEKEMVTRESETSDSDAIVSYSTTQYQVYQHQQLAKLQSQHYNQQLRLKRKQEVLATDEVDHGWRSANCRSISVDTMYKPFQSALSCKGRALTCI